MRISETIEIERIKYVPEKWPEEGPACTIGTIR